MSRATPITPDFRLVYQSGNEHNPGDPVGSVTLTITGDGAVTIENRSRGGRRQFAGTTTGEVIARVLAHLDAAGFPTVPPHSIPPGSALRNLYVDSNGRAEHAFPTAYHAVAQMPGYREAYEMLDGIVTLVSKNALVFVRSPDPGLASAS